MAKKPKTRLPKQEKPLKELQHDKKERSENEDNPADSLDFGGLPTRDLKKNLGCG